MRANFFVVLFFSQFADKGLSSTDVTAGQLVEPSVVVAAIRGLAAIGDKHQLLLLTLFSFTVHLLLLGNRLDDRHHELNELPLVHVERQVHRLKLFSIDLVADLLSADLAKFTVHHSSRPP